MVTLWLNQPLLFDFVLMVPLIDGGVLSILYNTDLFDSVFPALSFERK